MLWQNSSLWHEIALQTAHAGQTTHCSGQFSVEYDVQGTIGWEAFTQITSPIRRATNANEIRITIGFMRFMLFLVVQTIFKFAFEA